MNALGGLSWLENLNDTYLKVRVSQVSSLEIKILPVKKGEIIMTVYTVGDAPDASDSEIKFYDTELNPLQATKYFSSPQLKDFFSIPKGSDTNMKEIEGMIPFPTIEYNASPDNNDLTAKLTVEQYINQDDWNILKIFLKDKVVMEWKKDKYRVMK